MWTILGIVLAAMALPIGVLVAWFPSEISRLEERVSNTEVAVTAQLTAVEKDLQESLILTKEGKDAAQSASRTSKATNAAINNLIAAIAQESAMSIKPNSAEMESNMAALSRIFPKDLTIRLKSDGNLADFRYKSFMDSRFLFSRSAAFSKLTSRTQLQVRQSLEGQKIEFLLLP